MSFSNVGMILAAGYGKRMMPLTQSFRIPSKVHTLAMGIINKVRNRIDKSWNPKIHEGALSRYDDFEHINMTEGEWLVLARTKYMLTDLEDVLYRKGFYYKNKFKKTKEQNLHMAAIDWEHLRQGQLMHSRDIQNIAQYMGESNWEKKKLKALVEQPLRKKNTMHSLKVVEIKFQVM